MPGKVRDPRIALDWGRDGTGDVLVPDNFQELPDAELVLCDGGMSVEGQEARQEELLMPLLRAQCELAARCRADVAVVKCFDCFERGTAEALWSLARHFWEARLTKPLTSRPANSRSPRAAPRCPYFWVQSTSTCTRY